MNKKIRNVLAVFGALAILLCWPLAIGQIGQTQITTMVEKLKSPDVALAIKQYKRGYLTDEVLLEISIQNPRWQQQLNKQQLPIHYLLNTKIHHRLFGVTAQSTLFKAPNSEINNAVSLQKPFDLFLEQQIDLSGKGEFILTIAKPVWEDENEVRISGEQLKLVGQYALHDKKFSYQLTTPKLFLRDKLDAVDVNFDHILLEGQLVHQKSIDLQTVKLNAQSVELINGFGLSIAKAQQLTSMLSFQKSGNLIKQLESQTNFNYQMMLMPSQSHVALDWSIDSIDLAQLESWPSLNHSTNANGNFSTLTANSAPEAQQALTTTVSIHSFAVSMGKITLKANGQLFLPTLGVGLQGQKDKIAAEAWLKVNGDPMNSPMVAVLMANFIKQGWLEPVTKGYQSHFLVDKGQVSVNGQLKAKL